MIDEIDRRILVLLQSDASIPCSKIASEVGLSQPQCWRRIQQFRRDGWISNVVALLDRAKLGVGTQLFVHIRVAKKDPTSLAEFSRAIRELPEVLECHAVLGSFDFMLRVVVPSLDAYQRFHFDKLDQVPHVCEARCMTSVAEVKYTTSLPLM
ncbi:Lrp/AsnC family transcriptional regulator [Steroidobacter flavus]|uniref:Lrp/AsnC family transcriptional regulator n=1 Tax=Steroidobacter flavus TaxID=1842136 RepID=A0ABV8T7B2_9GAMM